MDEAKHVEFGDEVRNAPLSEGTRSRLPAQIPVRRVDFPGG